MPAFQNPPAHTPLFSWDLPDVWRWCTRFVKEAARYMFTLLGPGLPEGKRQALLKAFRENLTPGRDLGEEAVELE